MSADQDHPPLGERLAKLEAKLAQICANYITRDAFRPVQIVVYGMVAMMLSGAVAAILKTIGLMSH